MPENENEKRPLLDQLKEMLFTEADWEEYEHFDPYENTDWPDCEDDEE